MTWFTLTAIDTLFFRDGRPFNHGESNLQAVSSQFPPPASTVAGALRAALARTRGWQHGPWNNELKAVLGDGDNLGQLQFYGPYLRWRDECLFPVPASLLGRPVPEGRADLTPLVPGAPLDCDLGTSVRLPVPRTRREGLKEIEGMWLGPDGMARLLAGKVPDANDLVSERNLYRLETRVGIARDPQRRAVEEGMLYCTRHVRPVGPEVGFLCGLDNLPEDWTVSGLTQLGGETRMAWIEPASPPKLPPAATPRQGDGVLRYTVTLITPGLFSRWPCPGEAFAGLPGRVVSACLRRATKIGGWDSIARGPRPLRPFLPAGSVLFMEADANVETEIIRAWHGRCLGDNSAWGYGQILIGTWNEEG